jgi:arylsulfatase A-like enzyme
MSSELNRRSFLGLSGASLLAGVAGASSPPESPTRVDGPIRLTVAAHRSILAKRQNIVIFMPDEMRADSLGCYGNPVTKTPNFDRLAREGTRFENCHVQYPVCGASRCAMLTGWPTSVRGHRSLYYFLRPEEPNLFRYLRQADYDVFWFGKNDALASQSFQDSVTRWGDVGSGGLSRDGVQNLTPGSMSMLYSASGDPRKTGDYQLLQMANNILERKESDRPFCLFLPLIEPHPPYTSPKDFYDLYSPSSLPPLIPPGLKNKPEFHEAIRTMYGLDKLDDATFRKIRAVYYGQVSYSDWLLGELMEAISKNGRDKDTALFVTSDHGDYAGDYGLVEKWPSGLEDCLTRVPMIGRVPGGKAGVVAEDMVEMYDIMQTSLDIAQITANHTHFSRSMLPQMAGEVGDPNRAAFSEGGYNVYEPQCFEPTGAGGGPYAGKIKLQNERPATVSRSSMIRTRTHKLIVRPQGQSELYDCKNDPQETINLYGDSTVTELQGQLQTKLLEHYINTTGIAPTDKDPRNLPPYYPTRSDLTPEGWQKSVLDR